MVIKPPQITQELEQIAVGMLQQPPSESLEALITRKRQEQGIVCKPHDDEPGTPAVGKFIALPK